MTRYSKKFKARMIRKMTGPRALSASELAVQEDLHQTTLSRWLRDAGRVTNMTKSTTHAHAKRPQDWTAEEKLEAVLHAASLNDDELGGFLRRRGIHQAQVEQWREQMLAGLVAKPKKSTVEKRRIRTLERELRRKDKALAETSALLVLQKKVRSIWGDEDDDTPLRSER